jgi:hypothetical protein
MNTRFTTSMVVLIAAALLGHGGRSDPETEGAETRTDPFREGTGWYYHYVRANSFIGDSGRVEYPSTHYSSITSRINEDFYANRGVSNIMIYGPYEASPDFRGLPAIDFFEAQVGTERSKTSRTWLMRRMPRGSPSRSTWRCSACTIRIRSSPGPEALAGAGAGVVAFAASGQHLSRRLFRSGLRD